MVLSPDANSIVLIFRRAIRGTPDSRSVFMRVEDLVNAFGQEAANELAGRPLDVDAAKKSRDATRSTVMQGLYREREELEQIITASDGDNCRRELVAVQQQISKCESGKLDLFTVCEVNVGRLRAAINAAESQMSYSSGLWKA